MRLNFRRRQRPVVELDVPEGSVKVVPPSKSVLVLQSSQVCELVRNCRRVQCISSSRLGPRAVSSRRAIAKQRLNADGVDSHRIMAPPSRFTEKQLRVFGGREELRHRPGVGSKQ